MKNNYKKTENEDKLYKFTVNINFVGTPIMEKAIDSYLKETLETYFIERGEKITDCSITNINQYYEK